MHRFSSLLVSLLLLAASSFAAVDQKMAAAPRQLRPRDLCNNLARIKEIPPKKGEPGNDKLYNQIVQQGQAMVPCLIDKITDVTEMKDPRSEPTRGPVFRVGDLAFFILLDISDIPFEEMLPNEVKAGLEEEGVYAYFEYVQNPANRKALQQRCKEWLKEDSSRRRK